MATATKPQKNIMNEFGPYIDSLLLWLTFQNNLGYLAFRSTKLQIVLNLPA